LIEARPEFEITLGLFVRVRAENPAARGDRVESRDWLAADRLAAGDRPAALSLYGANIEMLAGSVKAYDVAMVALEYEHMGDAAAGSGRSEAGGYYRKSSQIWTN